MTRFYFVHSYYVHAEDRSLLAASVEYGVSADAALARDNLFAVQFHPEKSAGAGLQLLTNFLGVERTMLIIPAIDLKDGQCVRLRQGLMDDSTVFSDDPVAMAARWVEAGCRRLHLVDLNGAFAGEPVNGDVVTAIAAAYPDLPIQIGGGIRNLDTIEHYVRAGVSYVIIGTKAVKEPAFVAEACAAFPGKVIVGLDAKEGLVATDGWAEVSDVQGHRSGQAFESDGVVAIVYTDIARDGMMQGVNVEATVSDG